MMFEPESWTGLRSSGSMATVLAEPGEAERRETVFSALAGRVGAVFGHRAPRKPPEASDLGAETGLPGFLRERRLILTDRTGD
jgi:hypothetical protein